VSRLYIRVKSVLAILQFGVVAVWLNFGGPETNRLRYNPLLFIFVSHVQIHAIVVSPYSISGHPPSCLRYIFDMNEQKATIERDRSNEDVILVRLSERNKEMLLGSETESMKERKPQAEKVCQRMVQLNPDIAKRFSLKDVAASLAPLRLLFTRDAAVAKYPLQPVSSYIIVSYCWRNEDWTTAGLGATQEPWKIQQAFVNDLLAIRQSVDEGIWIDQPCIDQKNEEEKKMAIGVMDIIYRSARQLIIILEDVKIPDEEEEIVNRYWDMKRRGHPSQEWDVPEKDLKLMKSLFQRILSCRWFSRAWCSHEFRISPYFLEDPTTQPQFRAMNPRGTIVRIPSGLLCGFWLRLGASSVYNNDDFDSFKLCATPSTIQSMYMTSAMTVRGQRSLVQQLHDTVALGCSDKTDKIQIALNLSGLPLCWMDTAKTDDEVYWIFTVLALAAGEASVLAFRGPLLKLCNETVFSWARRSYHPRVECDVPANENDLRITSVMPAYLELDLFFLEKPAIRPSIAAIGLAEKILRDNKLCDRDNPIRNVRTKAQYESFLETQDVQLWHKTVRDIFACFIDGGYEWMKFAGNLFYEEFRKSFVRWDGIDVAGASRDHSNLSSAARALLSSQHIDDSAPAFTEKYLNPTINFLAVITDRRFLNFGQGDMRIDTSPSGDQALITTVFPGQKLAVPAVLADLQSAGMARLWMMEEVTIDGSPAWRMVNKGHLLACAILVPDGEFVVLRERQRVYGGEFFWEDMRVKQRAEGSDVNGLDENGYPTISNPFTST
jgi:hypothetical protein